MIYAYDANLANAPDENRPRDLVDAVGCIRSNLSAGERQNAPTEAGEFSTLS